ncbi:YheC/YheD family protein [Halobacillus litoralis]|uniref:YheC/YheD family protein n=1 Tax=Halobacillus litoralis TaxID=45668 RepID=UPI001CD62E5A|nr:YheC/YheD family protein [Halobacillus litoralis]MCA1022036.1 YheC/YheD family protein [Halobacillus litoralis]
MKTSKWRKYQWMKQSDGLRPFLPETKRLTPGTMVDMVKRHQQVILKPMLGYKGRGVIQLSDLGHDTFEWHIKHKKIRSNGLPGLYDHFLHEYGHRRYLIQQKICLAEMDGCPFDFRVMVQRKSFQKDWHVTGKLAKVAAAPFVVTNYTKQMLPASQALSAVFGEETTVEIMQQLDQLALDVVRHIAPHDQEHRLFGLDIAVDTHGHLWIIEANTKPDIKMFRNLPDLHEYKTIRAYKRG